MPDAMQSQRPSGMPLRFNGKLSGLLETMDAAGIDKGLALGVGIKASTVARTNQFIGTVPRDRLVPMGTVRARVRGGEPQAPEGERDRRRQAAPALPEPSTSTTRGCTTSWSALARGGYAGRHPRRRRRGRGGEPARRAASCCDSWPTRCPTSRSSPATTAGTTGSTRRRSTSSGRGSTLETSWPPTMAELDPERVVAHHPAARCRPRRLRLGLADGRPGGRDRRHPRPRAHPRGRSTGSSATTSPGCSGSKSA